MTLSQEVLDKLSSVHNVPLAELRLFAVHHKGDRLKEVTAPADLLWRVISRQYIPVVYRVRTGASLVAVLHEREDRGSWTSFGLPLVLERDNLRGLPKLAGVGEMILQREGSCHVPSYCYHHFSACLEQTILSSKQNLSSTG